MWPRQGRGYRSSKKPASVMGNCLQMSRGPVSFEPPDRPTSSRMRHCRYAAAFVLGALMWIYSGPTQCAEFWVATTTPFSRDPGRSHIAADFLDLFQDGSQWDTAAKNLKVFKIDWAFVDRAPIDVLRKSFEALQRRGISLGWEMGAIPPGKDCGSGTEGYAGDTEKRLSRIKEAGGRLDYVAMDEPFWFGHFAKTKNTCALTLSELASGVTQQLSLVYAAFPDVKVGDIEPVIGGSTDNFVSELFAWFDEFAKANGRPLSFFHADVNWQGDGEEELPAIEAHLREKKIRFGIIINGDPRASSDIAWTDAAMNHLQQVVDIDRLNPDDIVFQSWDDRPTRVLPETQPGTLMNLVREGSKPPAGLTLDVRKDAIEGYVTAPGGAALDGAAVTIQAADLMGVEGFRKIALAGVVPDGAVRAVFGLRLGSECNCSGPIDLKIDKLTFSQSATETIARYLRNPASILTISGAAPRASVNSAPFAVEPGKSYSADALVRVQELTGYAGYLSVIFLSVNGQEVSRDKFTLKASYRGIAQVWLDKGGKFVVPYNGTVPAGTLAWSLNIGASPKTRPTLFELLPK